MSDTASASRLDLNVPDKVRPHMIILLHSLSNMFRDDSETTWVAVSVILPLVVSHILYCIFLDSGRNSSPIFAHVTVLMQSETKP